jgi:RNA polymerase sigma-70 factor (ECF subfamily)
VQLAEIELLHIINGCLKNDEKARRKLYEMFAPKIMSICRRYTYSKYEADDIFQDAFVDIFRGLKTFDVLKGNFDGWIYTVAVNAALKSVRKNIKEKQLQLEDVKEQEITQVALDDGLEAEDLLKFIDELPMGKKTIFNLYVIEGYSHKEISSMLNISEGTSKSQLSKAKEMLVQIHNKYNRINEYRLF